MARFALLRHETPQESPRPAHWDLMLQHGAALCTWAMLELPTLGISVPAERLADHRLDYLDYEGPLSRNRGTVSQWDAGEYETRCRRDDHWTVELRGRKWTGELTLSLRNESAAGWLVRWVPQ